MERKFFRAFGYIFVKTSYEQGLRYKLIPKEIITCSTFCSSGYVESRDAETGTKAYDACAGVLLSDKDFSYKEYDLYVAEPAVFYCYDELLNNNLKVDFESVDISAGSEIMFSKGTKFLLCEGTLRLNDTTFTGPTAIEISSEDKTAYAETRCLGLRLVQ